MTERGPSTFEEFEASELYCSKCGRAQPVRKHLFLVLPTGNKYEYRCSVCGSSVGEKTDNDRSSFSILPPGGAGAGGDR